MRGYKPGDLVTVRTWASLENEYGTVECYGAEVIKLNIPVFKWETGVTATLNFTLESFVTLVGRVEALFRMRHLSQGGEL